MISTSGQAWRIAGHRPYIQTTVKPPSTQGMMSRSPAWNAVPAGSARSTTAIVANQLTPSVPKNFAHRCAMIGMTTA
jgi:hypothetical protein